MIGDAAGNGLCMFHIRFCGMFNVLYMLCCIELL